MTRVEITKLAAHHDARGVLFEPLESARLSGWKNMHAVITEPGAVRGNHKHLRGTEVTAVVGPALVRYCEDGQTCDAAVPAGVVWRFDVPPRVGRAAKETPPPPPLLRCLPPGPPPPAFAARTLVAGGRRQQRGAPPVA